MCFGLRKRIKKIEDEARYKKTKELFTEDDDCMDLGSNYFLELFQGGQLWSSDHIRLKLTQVFMDAKPEQMEVLLTQNEVREVIRRLQRLLPKKKRKSKKKKGR